MSNMLLPAVLDLADRHTRILRTVAVNHALSAGVTVLATGLTVFFVLADLDVQIGLVGPDRLILVRTYWPGCCSLAWDWSLPQPAEGDVCSSRKWTPCRSSWAMWARSCCFMAAGWLVDC
jgi:hypothetical protein